MASARLEVLSPHRERAARPIQQEAQQQSEFAAQDTILHGCPGGNRKRVHADNVRKLHFQFILGFGPYIADQELARGIEVCRDAKPADIDDAHAWQG